METQGQAPTQEMETFSFFFARLHLLICLRFTRVNWDNANARKCKLKVKTAWTCESPLRLHLRRRCEPGHDICFENPPYAVKNGDDEIMYDGTTGVRVSQWRRFSTYARVK